MGWDGMYPQQNCRDCGKPLNADGGHPAELYAGTFTGLCYGCERKGPFVVKEYRDGAQRISYPPHCPSWRRDREDYTAYPDCRACDGRGMTVVSRPMGMGGSYTAYCKECLDRFHEEPLRRRAHQSDVRLKAKAQRKYEDELRARKIITKARAGTAPPDLVEEARLVAQSWYEGAKVKLDAIEERNGVWV